MGRFCRLWKSEETDEYAIYEYGQDRVNAGLIKIDKVHGLIERIQTVPGLSKQDDWFAYSMLAKARLEKCFASGEYPDETQLMT